MIIDPGSMYVGPRAQENLTRASAEIRPILADTMSFNEANFIGNDVIFPFYYEEDLNFRIYDV